RTGWPARAGRDAWRDRVRVRGVRGFGRMVRLARGGGEPRAVVAGSRTRRGRMTSRQQSGAQSARVVDKLRKERIEVPLQRAGSGVQYGQSFGNRRGARQPQRECMKYRVESLLVAVGRGQSVR